MRKGEFPVAGSNGIIGYHDNFTTEGDGITIGRSGHSIGVPHFYREKFWAHNTVLYVKEFNENIPKFIFYLLKTFDFNSLNTGSAIPSLNRNHVHLMDVYFPSSLTEQKAIASVLSILDDKIDLLHRQNKTLEAMAEALFRQWFIEEAGDDWKDGCLGDLVSLNYGKSLTSKGRTGSGYPVVGSNGIVDYHSEYLVKAPGIVIGRKGTLGKTIYLSENFYPIDTTYFVISKTDNDKLYYEYFLLKTFNFEDMNTDSAVPGLNRELALSIELKVPPVKLINKFNSSIAPYFFKKIINCRQIRTLEQLRDTLLPKLMSGEVRVNCE